MIKNLSSRIIPTRLYSPILRTSFLFLLACCAHHSVLSFVGARPSQNLVVERRRPGGARTQQRGFREPDANNNNHNYKCLRADSTGTIAAGEQEGAAKRGMSFTLASVYFTVMGAKCALPATLSLLTASNAGLTFSPSSDPSHAFSHLFFFSTLAIAVGKIVLGPLIDHFGGILSLKIALSTLALSLMVISSCQSFSVFAMSWIFVDFIFSSCWAACINAIHESFPEDLWPRQISTIAAASRFGNAAAFAIFASLLQFFSSHKNMQQPWRPIFALSGAIQLLPVVLLTVFGKEQEQQLVDATSSTTAATTTATTRKPSLRKSLATVRHEFKRLNFWLHLISRSVLMVFASFLLFVPSLLTNVYQASPAVSAKVGSIYAIGCLLSVTLGSQAYARLPTRRAKIVTLVGLLGTATLSSLAQLGHMMGLWTLTVAASASSFFLWGFSFAIPFYIPPSLYALERGGVESSATIADVFDIGGFGLLAVFNGYVARIAQHTPSAWIPTFCMTTACSLISMISLTWAAVLERREQGYVP